jgi:hypothetical protein
MSVLAALLLAALVCTALIQSSARPASAFAAATPNISAAISEDDLIAKEKQVWDAIKRKDYDAFAAFLADDQMEVEANGVFDRAGTIKGVKEIDLSNTTLSDFKMMKVDNDAAIVTYLVKGPTPLFTAEGERHSTVWVKRKGKWLAIFHQGTTVAKPTM